ncbi:DUF11 domain-containing protein [Candidatus Laterigemmans baculatus]|nr:DUF11 domain-containing protein [Candidatus Laterigemmans baculatus]
MNRFGIRLAAGLAVITLGCLGIFQAQRSSQSVVEEPWDDAPVPAAIEPPTPLQLENAAAPVDLQTPQLAEASAADAELLVRGNDRGSDPAADGPSNGFNFGPLDEPAPAAGVTPAAASEMDMGSAMGMGSARDRGSEVASAGPDAAAVGPGGVQLAAHDEPAASGPASDFAFPQPLAPAAPASQAGPSTAEQFAAEPITEEPITEEPLAAEAQAEASAPEELAPEELAPEALAPDAAMGPAAAAPPATLQMPTMTFDGSGDEALDGGSLDAEAGNEAASGVTIGEIESGPAGSPLQMPQPLEPLPADAQALDTESANPLPEEPAAAGPADPAATPATASAPNSSAFNSSAAPQTITPPAVTPPAVTAQPRMSQPSGAASSMAAASGAAALQTVSPSEVLAEPGERRLEGAQTPSVVIHKRAPEEVRVGRPSDFVIQVKNVGTVAALDVRVFDSVPQGMQLVEVVPQAAEVDGLLCWQIGDLEPGGERTVTMRLIPEVEGELGSVARVTFEAAASVRTIATRPQLKLVQRAPEEVLIGQQVEIEVELSNVGSGTASGVMLQADLPEGLEHPMGRQLDNLIGAMPPGDVRRQILRLRATAPGMLQNAIRLVGEDGVVAESTVDIEVVSPALEVALDGPSLRYLERQTTYNVQVANSGTANASEVDIVAYLDRGLKFVSTEFEGQYDPNQHAVFWSLAELPAGQRGEVPLTLLPVEAGKHNVRLEAKADLGIAAASAKELAIETLAELSFSIADDQDPIETGTETTYEIRVQNTGSRDDGNVQLKVQLPAGMELISADPQAGTDGRGLVVFQPIARIDAKGEQVFRVRVRGASADTHVIQASLTSNQSPKPVTKEESTTVYSDR